MNLLDQAFVKAYTRTQSSATANSNIAAPHHRPNPAATVVSQDLSGRLAPIPDAVAWVEMADESYFRVDVGHSQAPRRSASTQATLAPATINAPTPAPSSARTGQPIPSQSRPSQSRPLQSVSPPLSRVNPTVISHTLTAYELPAAPAPSYPAHWHPAASYPAAPYPVQPLVREARVEQVRMRIDNAHLHRSHLQQPWAPARVEEPEVFFRGNRDQEQAEEFARAKIEAIAREEAAKATPPVVAVASPVAPAAVASPVALAAVASPVALAAVASPVAPLAPTPTTRSFDAVWEVDAYEYPETIVELFGDAKLMESIGAPLDHAVGNGLRSLLVTSVERGAGRTSVAIGIAVSAAAAGLRVALVDADTLSVGLAQTLGLDVEFGWLEAMRGNVPLEEVAIRSIEDQFIVVPSLANAARSQDISDEFDRMMSQLRESFDLIVVDGAHWEAASIALRSSSVDAAIVVVDSRNRDANRLARVQDDLRRVGVAGLGIVENFA